ncbi:MAG: 1-acyl-sn-glycerol-3-phosphate acyltransferase [Anaerolineales bacterium]|nr:1-acyl-sn-glycerol-3-phosphate acyltransferase [Anaerolineae bacterium]PWB50980.1 MAG: 1-acyl-sn-glycerol-3-phosphate acyltransferase [Anaerolineales bacterium]
MNIAYNIVNTSIKGFTRILCDVDDSQLVKVPQEGPLIIACNHINFMEVPLVFTHLQPRQVTGFAKAETWDNPLMGLLFDLWGAIPIQRGEADTTAFRKALEALDQGKILAITPEGTRSGTGKMGRGLPGITLLAHHNNTPILPMVYYGSERFRENINRLKRTDFNIKVGKLFRLRFPETRLSQTLRQKMVDEIMYQLADLLPEEYRGHYADFSKYSTDYIDFA